MQIIKFGLVGLMGTVIHYLTLILGVNFMALSVLVSSSFGFILGAFVNHHFNRQFTFSAEKPYSKTLFHFMIVATMLFFLNLLSMYILIEEVYLQYLIAQVITSGLVFVIGFVINKLLVFKS